MSIWAWVQPVDRIWKVVTDSEKGIIEVYNEKGELINGQKGLKKEEVSFIEECFFSIVATRLTDNCTSVGQVVDQDIGHDKTNVPAVGKHEYDYMYA